MLSDAELAAAKQAKYYGRGWTSGGYSAMEGVTVYKAGRTEG
jgi:hypothetical protein